jgi:methylated-DNA-[protein]-cysteine S-methyltransferase
VRRRAASGTTSLGTVDGVRVTPHRYAVDGWGVGELVVGEGLVLAHELPDPARLLDGTVGDPSEGGGLADRVVERVRAHLEGVPSSYDDLPLDLSWCATRLQEELARALRAVPWGEVVSYGELAALAGRPGAARAAGSFCAKNRFSLMLPCHRVVSATGIGGYGSSGVALKRRLLALEGVAL